MPPSKPRRLVDLSLSKVDRVAAGANPGAAVVLFKTANPVNKMTLSDTRSMVAAAVSETVGDYVWLVDYDPDNQIAVYDKPEHGRMAVTVVRDGDTFTVTGDPHHVAVEYRPIDKSERPAREKGDGNMPFDITQLDDDARAAFEQLTTERDNAVAKATETEQALAAATATPDPEPVTDPAELAKAADLPENVRKALEAAADAQARIAKMEDEQNTARFTAVAKSVGFEGDQATEAANVLKAVAAGHGEDSDVFKSLNRMLKAAHAQHTAAMEILGKASGHNSNVSADNVRETFNQLIAKHRLDNPSVTYTEAFDAVRKANPDLVEQYESARKG